MYTQIIIKNFLLFFFTEYKNEWEQHKFRRQKNKKKWLIQQKQKLFNTNDIDVNKILVSKKEQYGKFNSFKYFIWYNDNDAIKPLYLELSQMTGYINKFNENKNKSITMSLKVKDKILFKNYNKIWKKMKN